jgi:hypothetical protein
MQYSQIRHVGVVRGAVRGSLREGNDVEAPPATVRPLRPQYPPILPSSSAHPPFTFGNACCRGRREETR